MKTEIVHANGGKTCFHEDGRITSLQEFHLLAKDPKPIEGVNNAAILFIMDWLSLTDAEKAAARAQVWEFDAENQKWHPQ